MGRLLLETGSLSGCIYTTHIKLAGSTLLGQGRMRETTEAREVKDGNLKHALRIRWTDNLTLSTGPRMTAERMRVTLPSTDKSCGKRMTDRVRKKTRDPSADGQVMWRRRDRTESER